MPSWLTQGTTNASTSTSTFTSKSKKTFAASFPKPFASRRVGSRARPPPVRLPMLPQSAPRSQRPTSFGSGARAGKAAGDAKGVPSSIVKPPRIPFSPIQPDASGAAAYPTISATRTVRFQLPPSVATDSSSAEPSPQPQPPVKTAARGPEYVTITRPEHERQRRRPEPLHLRPQPTSGGFAYPYPYSPFSPYDGAFGGRENVKAAPAVPEPRVGPIRLLKTLQSGAFGASYVAHDITTGRVVCTRTVKKDLLDKSERLKRGLRVEALCYKTIAASNARQRAHLMEAHGILQDEESILFVMVRVPVLGTSRPIVADRRAHISFQRPCICMHTMVRGMRPSCSPLCSATCLTRLRPWGMTVALIGLSSGGGSRSWYVRRFPPSLSTDALTSPPPASWCTYSRMSLSTRYAR